jgi:hypothetical protein
MNIVVENVALMGQCIAHTKRVMVECFALNVI